MIYKNGYSLEEKEYNILINKFYGYEEYYYYKKQEYYNDYIFISNELDKINRNISMDEAYKNAILGWFISFNNIPRKLSTHCITFRITDACQLQCKHCYQQYKTSQNKFMTYDNFICLFYKHINISNKFISKDNKCAIVVFEGGEATLNKDLAKMIQFVNSKNISAILLTNGLYIPNDVLEALKNNPDNKVQVSIDGLEETHDFIRGKGTFKKSIENIKLLRDNGINVYANFVANNINYKEFLSLKKFLELENINITCLHYTPQNKNDISSLNKEELQFILPYYNNDFRNHSIGTLKCSDGNVGTIMETGDFLSCRRIMSNDFYSITNYFTDTEEECVEKIKKYAIRSRSVPSYCIPCKKVNSCLGGMLCSRSRTENKFNLEDIACHLLNKAEF